MENKMKIGSIYVITCKTNNKKYVGFTNKTKPSVRFKEHIRLANNPENKDFSILHAAIRKYGPENFNFEVIYQSKDCKYLLEEMEPYFIKKYDSFGKNGYNATKGGDGVLGLRAWNKGKVGVQMHSEHSRNKISLAMQGVNNPMYGVSLFGKKNGMFGKKHTIEAKMIQSEANIKYNYTLYFADGRILNTTNLKQFCRENNYNTGGIHYMITGKCKRHKDIVKLEKQIL